MTISNIVTLYPLQKELSQVTWHFCILELEKGGGGKAQLEQSAEEPHPAGFGLSPKTETPRPFWATCSMT